MKRGIKSGNITPNSSLLKFSDDAVDEQKHAIRIADEKVALAVQAYDLVNMEVSLICVVVECDLVPCSSSFSTLILLSFDCSLLLFYSSVL